MMKTCVHCEAILDDSAAFCTKCGASQATERICPTCGSKVAATSNFCPNCGCDKTGAATAANAALRPTQTIGAQAPPIGGWFIFSIVTALFFCPIGIGALVFSIMSNNAASRGDALNALKYEKIAKWWNIVVWVLGLLSYLFFFFTMIVGAALEL